MARLASKRIVWLALLLNVLAVVGFALLGQGALSGNSTVVALQLAFTEERFGNIIEQWGPAGVQAYQTTTIWIDSWFPVAYALLLSSLVAVLTRRAGKQAARSGRMLFGLPWLAMALDWLENGLHLILLRSSGDLSGTLVWVASLAAAVKWGLIAVTVFGLIFCFLRPLAYNWVKR